MVYEERGKKLKATNILKTKQYKKCNSELNVFLNSTMCIFLLFFNVQSDKEALPDCTYFYSDQEKLWYYIIRQKPLTMQKWRRSMQVHHSKHRLQRLKMFLLLRQPLLLYTPLQSPFLLLSPNQHFVRVQL